MIWVTADHWMESEVGLYTGMGSKSIGRWWQVIR